jgi:hypothetical protein
VPEGLRKIIEKGMAKDREQRIDSSAALAAALEPYARSRRGETVDTGARTAANRRAPERGQATSARAYFVAALCAFLVLGVMGWGGWVAFAAERAGAAPEAQRSPILTKRGASTPSPVRRAPAERSSAASKGPVSPTAAMPPAPEESAPNQPLR